MENQIVLYDGYCQLCSRWVQFLLKRDYKKNIQFVPLQSEEGKQILKSYVYENDRIPDTVIYIENDSLFIKSTAILRLIRHFRGIWKVLYLFIIIPKFIRDKVYDCIAKKRYIWFKKRDNCFIPH